MTVTPKTPFGTNASENGPNAGKFTPRLIRNIYADAHAAGRPVLSIEFFPPKTLTGERNLLETTIPELLTVKPDFCSVTYGAGGSTRDKTIAITDRIQRMHGLTTMAHLTCVNSSQQQISEFLAEAKDLGICNILALRGDPPSGSDKPEKLENGFEYSYELIDFIRKNGGFSIGTAGLPEGRAVSTEDKHTEWSWLQTKIDYGADFILTQLFFDNTPFFEFWDYLVKTLGVTVPICPGVLPIRSVEEVKRFTALCGVRLPADLISKLEKLEDNTDEVTKFGIDYATKQCEELLRGGVPGLHIYSLNKSYATTQIVKNLGLA